MTEENKPLESDTEDELDDELFGDEETQAATQPEVGDTKDVDATKEFLTKVSQIAGRKFNSIEEYEKHYKNLSSFVGKKVEPKAQPQETPAPKSDSSLKEVLENQKRIEFLMENPDAKKHYTELVKPLADGKGITPAEAWEIVKPMVQSSEEQEKEKEIGVNSKNRIKTVDSKLKPLVEEARKGNPRAQQDFIAKALGLE